MWNVLKFLLALSLVLNLFKVVRSWKAHSVSAKAFLVTWRWESLSVSPQGQPILRVHLLDYLLGHNNKREQCHLFRRPWTTASPPPPPIILTMFLTQNSYLSKQSQDALGSLNLSKYWLLWMTCILEDLEIHAKHLGVILQKSCHARQLGWERINPGNISSRPCAVI